MKTLVKTQEKLTTISVNSLTQNFKEQLHSPKAHLHNPKTTLEIKFYQNLFLVFWDCPFLIFPESPNHSENYVNNIIQQRSVIFGDQAALISFISSCNFL